MIIVAYAGVVGGDGGLTGSGVYLMTHKILSERKDLND